MALATFLERGFEQTTTEEIAGRAGMSKRTLYARYEDKAALFKAAVRRAIALYTVPRAALDAIADDDLKETLRRLAHLRIANIATPASIALQRILASQAYRFPELFQAAFDEGAGPTIDFLHDLFARHATAGPKPFDPRIAASAFLSLAVSGPARRLVSGAVPDDTDTAARIDFAVDLFVDGLGLR